MRVGERAGAQKRVKLKGELPVTPHLCALFLDRNAEWQEQMAGSDQALGGLPHSGAWKAQLGMSLLAAPSPIVATLGRLASERRF